MYVLCICTSLVWYYVWMRGGYAYASRSHLKINFNTKTYSSFSSIINLIIFLLGWKLTCVIDCYTSLFENVVFEKWYFIIIWISFLGLPVYIISYLWLFTFIMMYACSWSLPIFSYWPQTSTSCLARTLCVKENNHYCVDFSLRMWFTLELNGTFFCFVFFWAVLNLRKKEKKNSYVFHLINNFSYFFQTEGIWRI